MAVGTVGFACDIRGSRYDRCRCDLNSDGQLVYSALATECTALDGTKVRVGETYTHKCTNYRCVEKNSGLVLELDGERSMYNVVPFLIENTEKFF